MTIYAVTITVLPDIEAEWLDWMKRVHVPDVLRTGCFLECHIYKVSDADGDDRSYVLQYHCRSPEEYQRYRENFAPALQQEHSDKFTGRFRASRQLLKEVALPAPNKSVNRTASGV